MQIEDMLNSINAKDTEYMKQVNNTFEEYYDKLIGDVENIRKIGGNIVIVGDYDADGICSSMILSKMIPDAEVVLGDRFKSGYGISMENLESHLKPNTMVICTDIGSNELEKIKNIYDKNKSYIYIVDHHEISDDYMNEYPLLLNFHKKEKVKDKYIENEKVADYCATGLAYKLYMVDYEKTKKDNIKELNTVKAYASIGTVGDMVKVNNKYDDNREIILDGFKAIDNANPSNIDATLIRFLDLCGIDGNLPMNTHEVGFKISNVMNAYGRLYEDGANKVFEALSMEILDNENKLNRECDLRLKELITINDERKNIQKEIRNTDAYKDALNSNDNIIILTSDNIPQGITGLVSGDISNNTNKPCITLTKGTDGNYVGSGRNPEGYPSMFDLCKSDYAIKIGGHEGAIGLSVSPSNLDKFVADIKDKYKDVKCKEIIKDKLELTDNFNINDMMKLEPFGTDFPKPYVEMEVEITSKNVRTLGGNEKMKRITLTPTVNAVTFDRGEDIKVGDKIIVGGELDTNTFNGSRTLQISISSIENADKVLDSINIKNDKAKAKDAKDQITNAK